MAELTNDSCRPVYKNELSNFKKETLEKVEEFKSARNKWITKYSNQTVNTGTKEGLYKTNEYRGSDHSGKAVRSSKMEILNFRCALLRRMRFKTTFLRVHHKVLRPLKFYTFKQKLSDAEIERVINESLEKSKTSRGKCAELNENLAPVDYLEKKSAKKGKSKKKIFPSKAATKKLKSSKLETRLVDSCRCKGKKGLTVVIKGVCLCDKTTLNKLTLGEVCNKFSKLELKNTGPAEPNLSHTANSLELYKKKMSQYPLEKIKEEKENTITQPEPPSKKHVKFKHHDKDAEIKTKLMKNDAKVPAQKSSSTNTKPIKTSVIKWGDFKEEINDQNNDKINKLELHTKKNLLEQKNVTENFLKNKSPEEKIETSDSNASTITLYKNKPQEPSDLGLTEEQHQKMKKILRQIKKIRK